MNWGLLLQFQFLNIVDQPVFVYRFHVPGPPIIVIGISTRRRGIRPFLSLN